MKDDMGIMPHRLSEKHLPLFAPEMTYCPGIVRGTSKNSRQRLDPTGPAW